MTKLSEFFKTAQGAAAGQAIAKVIGGGAAVVAAMAAAIPAPAAYAFPLSSVLRTPAYSAPVVNYQDVLAFDAKLQPLKEQREAYEGLILGYADLLDRMREQTFEPGLVSGREQIEVYKDVILAWIADSHQDLKDSIEDESQANVVEASVSGKTKLGSDKRVFEDAYRKIADRNSELREAIERMSANLYVVTEYGEAGINDVSEAFKAYNEFERELVVLDVRDAREFPVDDTSVTPITP
jgi:hypothetical protein